MIKKFFFQFRQLNKVWKISFAIIFGLYIYFKTLNTNGYIYWKEWTGFENKTFWDWLNLIIIPASLLIFGYFIERRDKKETEFQEYINFISNFLRTINITDNSSVNEIRPTVQIKTSMLISKLDNNQKIMLLLFLSSKGIVGSHNQSPPIVSLSSLRLSNISLIGIDLSGSNLFSSKIKNSDLRYAKFNYSKIDRANYSGSNFANSLFKGGLLSNSSFYFVNLVDTKFINSHLSETTFMFSHLNNADFCGASLSLVDFRFCDIRGVDFSNAKLDKINFKFAKYNSSTKMPAGFDLKMSGAIYKK